MDRGQHARVTVRLLGRQNLAGGDRGAAGEKPPLRSPRATSRPSTAVAASSGTRWPASSPGWERNTMADETRRPAVSPACVPSRRGRADSSSGGRRTDRLLEIPARPAFPGGHAGPSGSGKSSLVPRRAAARVLPLGPSRHRQRLAHRPAGGRGTGRSRSLAKACWRRRCWGPSCPGSPRPCSSRAARRRRQPRPPRRGCPPARPRGGLQPAGGGGPVRGAVPPTPRRAASRATSREASSPC